MKYFLCLLSIETGMQLKPFTALREHTLQMIRIIAFFGVIQESDKIEISLLLSKVCAKNLTYTQTNVNESSLFFRRAFVWHFEKKSKRVIITKSRNMAFIIFGFSVTVNINSLNFETFFYDANLHLQISFK